MEDKIIKYQVEVANNEKGCFIPYIGEDYTNGLGAKDTKVKVLVIAPRHYCDASKDPRNRFINLINYSDASGKIPEEALEKNRNKCGCMELTAENCLEKRYNKCPVFKNKLCPLNREKCKIKLIAEEHKDKFKCNDMRNLRCETLIAIKDFLDMEYCEKEESQYIYSHRAGKQYFEQITEFVISSFKPVNEDYKYIWNRLAFSNLIQRYISTNFTNDQEINKKVREEDRNFIKTLIKALAPDVIIATMKCVRNNLKTIVNNLGYQESKEKAKGQFYVYKKSSLCARPDIWKEIFKKCIEECPDYVNSVDYKQYINGVIKGLKNDHGDSMVDVPKNNELLVYLRDLLTTKILKIKSYGKKIDNKLAKNLIPKGLYYNDDKCGSMGSWLRAGIKEDDSKFIEGKNKVKEILIDLNII